jgi:diguanylate cyclase (GGDEF)-like protein
MVTSANSLLILVVEDQSALSMHLSAVIEGMGHSAICAADAQTGLALYQSHQPDLILLDVLLPDHDGYWLAKQIRQQEPEKSEHWTPIVFLSCMSSDKDLQEGIDAGGDDYLIKPVSAVVLGAKLRAQQRLLTMRKDLSDTVQALRNTNYRLNHLCSHDELTGLVNRRGLNDRLTQYLGQARREQRPLTVMMCDIDHFKRYNDRLGHLEGDACLQHIAGILSHACKRPLDFCARFGGEEFAIVLPFTTAEGGNTFALSLMHQLMMHSPSHPDSPIGQKVTISGGLATFTPEHPVDADTLLKQADVSLYAAKLRGRNRCVDLTTNTDTSDWMKDGAIMRLMSGNTSAIEAA